MISYVECLSGEASPGVTSRCFSPVPESDETDQLLPRKVPILQPKTEGSLRRRLLSARIHQRQQYAAIRTPSCDSLYQENKPAFANLGFVPNRRTSSCPPNPEPRPGYVRPQSPAKNQDLVDLRPTVPPQFKYKPKKRRGFFRRTRRNKEMTQTTPLLYKAGDPDKKWSVHYTTHKPLHGLLFLPSSTRGSQDQTSPVQGLWLNQQYDCSSAHPALFPSGPRLDQSERGRGFDWRHRGRKMKSRFRDCLSESCFSHCLQFSVRTRKSSVDSDDDERLVVGGTRPMTPLVLTSCWEGQTSCYEVGTSCGGLPTPEERTRRQAQTVMADIVPINVTGESFDRQASLHRSLSNRDSLNRRPSLQGLQRRRTITGTNQDYSSEQEPVHFSKSVRPSSVQSSSKTPDLDQNLNQKEVRTEPRRIRAPRRELSSLMATLTSSKRLQKQDVHPTSCPPTQSPDSATYRAIYYRPSDCQSESQSVCSSSSHLQEEPWSYQPLSPSTSLHSTQESSSVCGEGWSCDPLLFSGLSSPSHHSLNSDTTSCTSSTNLQNNMTYSCSQTSLYLDENASNSSGQNGEKMAAFSLLNFNQNMSPSYSSLCSESASNICANLDRNSSYSQSSLCSSSSLKLDKRSSVSSRSSLCRSISLRKSKCPPAPPIRNDSLRRKPTKPPRNKMATALSLEKNKIAASSSPEKNKMAAGSSKFTDPWVPRNVVKRRQSGLNCGTVSTFEPIQLEPNDGLSTQEQQQEIPHTANNSQASVSCENGLQRLASPSSGYSSQSNTPLSSPITPSSPLTPNSENPVYPVLPVGLTAPSPSVSASSFPRTRSSSKPRPPERKSSLFSSLSSSFSSTSSLSSYTSSSESSVKHLPPPPQPPPLPGSNQQRTKPPRKMSLSKHASQESAILSTAPPSIPPNIISSNPQSAILSSSARPLPPPPPPLPQPSSLPTPPPLPNFNQEHAASPYQTCDTPLNVPSPNPESAMLFYNNSTASISLPPHPPPLPPLKSLQTPSSLPNFSQESSASSYQIRNPPFFQNSTPQDGSSVCFASSAALPPPPPLPPHSPSPAIASKIATPPSPPPLSSFFLRPQSPSFPQSPQKPNIFPKSPKMSKPTSPLVTTEALQNIKLRSVKSQEFIRTNSLPTMETAQGANTTNLDVLKKKAYSATSIHDSSEAKVIKCENSDARDRLACPNLSPPQNLTRKDEQEASNPVSTDANAGEKLTEEANTPLIAHYNLTKCENSNPSIDLAAAEVSFQECFGEKLAEDKNSHVSHPKIQEAKSGDMLTDDAGVYPTANQAKYNEENSSQNKRIDDFKDPSKTEIALNSMCCQENSIKSSRDAYNQTKCGTSNLHDSISDAKRVQKSGFSEHENDQDCEDLVNSEDFCQLSKETYTSFKTDFMAFDHLSSQQDCQDTANSSQTRKDPTNNKKAFLDENYQVELDKKSVIAEVKGKDFNVQETQVTKVKQYELKTSQTYFQGCDNLQNPEYYQENLENLSEIPENDLYKERHQAYLDMYAMLAESKAWHDEKNERKTHRKNKKSQNKSKSVFYSVMEQDMTEFSELQNGDKVEFASFIKQERFGECFQDGRNKESDPKDFRVASSESPWVKMPEDESQYWSLSREKKTQKDNEMMSNVQEAAPSLNNLKEAMPSPSKVRSPVKPALPKKPDLGILGLLSKTGQVKNIASEKAQVSSTTLSNSPCKEKPPILHKKPDLSTITSFKLSIAENVWNARTVENCVTSQIWATRTAENDNLETILESSSSGNVGASESSISGVMDSREVTGQKQKRDENFDACTLSGMHAIDYNGELRMWGNRTMQNYDDFSQNTSNGNTIEDARIQFSNLNAVQVNLGTDARKTGEKATRICGLESCGQVWSPGTCENLENLEFSDTRDYIWDTMEDGVPSRNGWAIENISMTRVRRSEDDDANWAENSEKPRYWNNCGMDFVEDSSENIWCPRNIKKNSGRLENGRSGAGLRMQGDILENGGAAKSYSQQNTEITVQNMQLWKNSGMVSRNIQREIRSSHTEDDEFVMDRVEGLVPEMAVMPNKKSKIRRKRRAKLLMQKLEKSSSSSSLTSGSENEFDKSVRVGVMRDHTSESDESSEMTGQSRFSISSALSTDSLQVAMSLPDLLIQEEEEQRRQDDDVFVGVSADQVTVSTPARTTDDLFAIIHRSKRKMFGRQDSGVYCSSSSSCSPPSTPTDLNTLPKAQSISRSDNFKSLLLKKGGHLSSTSRLSAVERLCGVKTMNSQRTPQNEDWSLDWVGTSCGFGPGFGPGSGLKQRPLTPPCSSSRWFSSRIRLHAVPMTAILENQEEEEQEEEDDDVFE